METRLNLGDAMLRRLKQEAARQGRTMSDLDGSALRALLEQGSSRKAVPAFAAFRGRGVRVNVANPQALHKVIER